MAQELPDQLRREIFTWVLQCFTELGPRLDGVPPVVTAAIELLERMDGPSGPRIAIAGRFNAGKTTLVNTILGGRVLMEGMTETTAIPTRVRKGESIRVLLKKSQDAWYEASEAERREFLQLRAAEMSPLVRRYLEQQDEVLFEHPAMLTDIEVVDLPGVSSSFQNVEARALQSLQFANAVLWVSNAKEGGLTRADLDYVRNHVPTETPRLFVLTHLDLLPPSSHASVLANAERSVQGMAGVIGVVGSMRGNSLVTDPRLRPHWAKLVTSARKNNRLKPLVHEIVQILEGMQDVVKEETSGQTLKFADLLGLSQAAYEQYVDRLFKEYRSSIEGLDGFVDGNEHLVGWHLDSDAVWKNAIEQNNRINELCVSASKQILKKYEIHQADAAMASIPVMKTLIDYWDSTAGVFGNHLLVAHQMAATLGWRFETPLQNGNISGAFDVLWKWNVFRDFLTEPLLTGYKSVLDNAVEAIQERHKLRELWGLGVYFRDTNGLLDALGVV